MKSFINLFPLQNSLQVSKKLKSDLCNVLFKRYIFFDTSYQNYWFFFILPQMEILWYNFRTNTTKTKKKYLQESGVVQSCMFKNHFPLYKLVRMVLSVNGPSSSDLMMSCFTNKALMQDTELSYMYQLQGVFTHSLSECNL